MGSAGTPDMLNPPEPEPDLEGLSGAILAGGRSTRMGTNKAFASLAGVRLLDRARHTVSQIADDVMLVTNQLAPYADFPGRVVMDNVPHRGPLCGLETALAHAHHPVLFVTAVDCPFLELSLLQYLARFAPHYDAVYCMGPVKAEPLVGFYRYTCLKAVQQMQTEGVWQLFRLPHYANVRVVPFADVLKFDPEGITFFNINTPEDLKRAELLFHTRRWGRAG
jgi:molybdopterin-guanine dinucleotide biosynthesis protein A